MTIAIVLTLQEVPLRYYYYCGLPIAILLRYYCLKHLCLFGGENQEYGRTFLLVRVPIFVWKQQKNFSILFKFTYLAEMIGMQQHIHPIAI